MSFHREVFTEVLDAALEQAFREVKLCAVEACFSKLQDVLRKVKGDLGGNSYELGHRKQDEESNDEVENEDENTNTDDDERDTKPPALNPPDYKGKSDGVTAASV